MTADIHNLVQMDEYMRLLRCTFCSMNLCCVQHATGMPSSYQLGMMSQQAATLPYPQATSPALLQQYQYHGPPAAPVRAPAAAHCSDYYIPVMHDQQHSYPVNIPSTQHPQQQLPPPPQPQCFTGVYDSRPCAPATLPGVQSPFDYFIPGMGTKYCYQHVCVSASLCLSVCWHS